MECEILFSNFELSLANIHNVEFSFTIVKTTTIYNTVDLANLVPFLIWQFIFDNDIFLIMISMKFVKFESTFQI